MQKLFEVLDYQSPYYRHIFKVNGFINHKGVQVGVHLVVHDKEVKVNGQTLVHVIGGSEPFLFSQIKPIENELIINYVHPINGNCNHSFPKSELKRASHQYWLKYDMKPTINFKPIAYKLSKPNA